MPSPLTRLFSFAQKMVFVELGNRFPNKEIKRLMDYGFIIFEKMGVKFPAIAHLYLQFYSNVVQQETILAKITPADRVLVIGSGSLPATPILITRTTGATVVSIDHDQSAVKASTQFIRNIHLDHSLSIAHGEGLTYPVKDFTVVYILYGVKNTQAVLASLPSRISDGCRVVLRLMCDQHRKIIGDLDITSYFTIKNQVHTTALGSFETFLLEKKPT